MNRKQTNDAPRMVDPGHKELDIVPGTGDMKFFGPTGADRHMFGNDMKMADNDRNGMQHHNPSSPDQPKTMRYLKK